MCDLKIRTGFKLGRRPRILFCDVDRTLLTHDRVLLPEVAAAMRSLRSIDLPVVLASARSPGGLERVHAQVGALDSVCCFNGAWIGKLSSRETLKQFRLGRDLALEAMAAIHAAGGSPIWFDLKRCYALAPDEEVARRRTDDTGDELQIVRGPADAPDAPFKLLATFGDDRISEAVEGLSKRFSGSIAVSQSGPNLVEFVDPLAGKDIAARYLAQGWNVDSHDVAAAGDSDNDIEMLNWAGLGITVANAKRHIQEIADVVAPSCDDGGLAHVLKWLVRNGPRNNLT